LLPYFTVPGFPLDQGFEPFYAQLGANVVNSVSGKMYAFNGTSGPGLYLIDRTLGSIPQLSFNPGNYVYFSPIVSVYNIGNQNLNFTDSTHLFTESGNGAGAFTFGGGSCQAGGTVVPSAFCTIPVTNVNAPGTGPAVTDTLHFLTNAANDNAVSFKIYGYGKEAPAK
jgi:hypothetical protein